jgi:iron complex transport system substrate-binding protein
VPAIVSLLPSLTEVACALGAAKELVGRSHECDFPEGVARLPVCTRPRFLPEGSSREIDERVKSVVRDGLSVYEVDPDRLAALRPDVVLTQDQCEVCAASLADVEAALAQLTGLSPKVVSVAPSDLAGVWRSILAIGDALGRRPRAEALVGELTARISAIGERSGGLARPRVAAIEWIDPLMAAGNWVPEIVQLAGGAPVFGVAGAHSPWLRWEALRESDPDVLILMPCGFDLRKTRRELPTLLALPGFDTLRAVAEREIYLVDGNQYFNRPGPRLVESVEITAEILHPEGFAFGHAGRGFERL